MLQGGPHNAQIGALAA